MSNEFGFDFNELKNLGEELSGGEFQKTIQIKEKETYIRLLPHKKWFHKCFKHWGYANFPITCKKSWDTKAKCPLCEDMKKPGRADKNLQKRIIVYAKVGRKSSEYGAVELPIGAFKKIISIFQDPEYGDLTSPQKGVWLKVLKLGSGMSTKYDVLPGRNAHPVSTDVIKEQKLPDIEEYLGNKNEDLTQYIEEVKNNTAPFMENNNNPNMEEMQKELDDCF